MSKVFPTIYAFGWRHVKLGQHSEKLEMPTPIEKQKPPAEFQQTQQWRLPKNHESLLNSRRFFCQLRHVKFLDFFFTFTHGLFSFLLFSIHILVLKADREQIYPHATKSWDVHTMWLIYFSRQKVKWIVTSIVW